MLLGPSCSRAKIEALSLRGGCGPSPTQLPTPRLLLFEPTGGEMQCPRLFVGPGWKSGGVTRVWFTTNYPMAEARRLVDRGVYPRQHLWGADDLAAQGYDVRFGPFAAPGAAPRWTRSRFGNLAEQTAIAGSLRRGDIIYSADERTARGFALARRAGLRRFPLLTVFHHLPKDRIAARAAMRGPDVALCLSSRLRDELCIFGRRDETTIAASWGPDLRFAGYRSSGATKIVSCGKTNRDVKLLLRALSRIDHPARVYVQGEIGDAPASVELVNVAGRAGRTQVEFGRALADLSSASVVAVPLRDANRLSGLTEVNDALALGKPIVMTRSPFMDVDIEAIGCGIWVDLGDVDGWVSALTSILEDDGRRTAMGRAGRAFAERSWNVQLFGRAVTQAVAYLG